jgi:intracellular multiplication protein IcmG
MIIDDKEDPKENEDYQFNEDELMGSDLASGTTPESKYETSSEVPPASSVTQRNAFIVVAGLITLYLIYRLVMWASSPSVDIPKKTLSTDIKVIKVQPKPVPSAPISTTLPPPAITPTPTASPDIEKKLTSLLSAQDKLQADLQSLMTTVTGLQSNVQNVAAKIDELTKLVNDLNVKIDNQATLIKVLEVKRVEPPKLRRIRHVRRVGVIHEPIYLQAVIPGRAWLIKRNGTDTITVREGTRVPGYGVVQLIDPNQGRVVMTSGRVITFGQWDS